MPNWLLILIGLFLLMGSAELMVRGAVWIARAAGIRPMVVGLTVVAFGTSAPELAASLMGALEGRPGLATGTVLGSNIANIALILGMTALFAPIRRADQSPHFELRFLLAMTLMLPVPVWLWGEVPSWWGAGLLFAVLWFTWHMVMREKRGRGTRQTNANDIPHGPGVAIRQSLSLLVGLLGLAYGADLLVTGATGAASDLGVSDQVVASVIIAVGTSLPELAASVAAALRRQPEIAVGNVIGSNLFNIGMVLGGTATIAPLPFTWGGEGYHLIVCIGLTVFVMGLVRFAPQITRWQGVLLLASYAAYLTGAVFRG